jgi:hypothetical protein
MLSDISLSPVCSFPFFLDFFLCLALSNKTKMATVKLGQEKGSMMTKEADCSKQKEYAAYMKTSRQDDSIGNRYYCISPYEFKGETNRFTGVGRWYSVHRNGLGEEADEIFTRLADTLKCYPNEKEKEERKKRFKGKNVPFYLLSKGTPLKLFDKGKEIMHVPRYFGTSHFGPAAMVPAAWEDTSNEGPETHISNLPLRKALPELWSHQKAGLTKWFNAAVLDPIHMKDPVHQETDITDIDILRNQPVTRRNRNGGGGTIAFDTETERPA